MSQGEGGVIAAHAVAAGAPDAVRFIDLTSLARQCRYVSIANFLMLVLGTLKVPRFFSIFISDPTLPNFSLVTIGMTLYGACAWVAWRTRGGLDAVTYRYSIPAFMTLAAVSLIEVAYAKSDVSTLALLAFDILAGLAAVGGIVAILTLRRTWLPDFSMPLEEFLQHGFVKVHEPSLRSEKSNRAIACLIFGFAWLVGIDLIPTGFILDNHLGVSFSYANGVGFLCLLYAQHYFRPNYQTLIRLDPRPPVLFLRSFVDDSNTNAASGVNNVLNALGFAGYNFFDYSFEDRLGFHFSPFGPFIAVTGPKKEEPVGAVRLGLTNEEWQNKIVGLMEESRLIVVLAGVGKSLAWELEALDRGEHIPKTLFIFSPKGSRQFRRAKIPSPSERLLFLSRSLGNTSWGKALRSLREGCNSEDIRAIVCSPTEVVVLTSRTKTRDSYYIGTVVAHYLMQRREHHPARQTFDDVSADAHSTASIGIRSIATALDSVLILSLYVICMTPNTPSPTGLEALSGISVLAFFYYLLLEGLAGATLGKAVCAVEIRSNIAGKTIGMKASLIRNLLRIVDAVGFYAIGFAIARATPLRQRLGDRLAGTVVVRRRRPVGIRLALCALFACLTAAGTGTAIQEVHRGAHVRVGNDQIYYSGSVTRATATALGSALKDNGFFTDKGYTTYLSKDGAESVFAIVVKDGFWDKPDAALSWGQIGLGVSASVGGLPLKVRLLDSKHHIRKDVMVGKVTFGSHDNVFYFGKADEAEAKALGAALRPKISSGT